MLSFAKEEKVVNPPQKPVLSSRYHALSVELFLPNIANTIPKRKHPSRLTVNVPQGNPWSQAFFISVESRYLMAPPKKLPVPTINNAFSISFQSLAVREGIAHTLA